MHTDTDTDKERDTDRDRDRETGVERLWRAPYINKFGALLLCICTHTHTHVELCTQRGLGDAKKMSFLCRGDSSGQSLTKICHDETSVHRNFSLVDDSCRLRDPLKECKCFLSNLAAYNII